VECRHETVWWVNTTVQRNAARRLLFPYLCVPAYATPPTADDLFDANPINTRPRRISTTASVAAVMTPFRNQRSSPTPRGKIGTLTSHRYRRAVCGLALNPSENIASWHTVTRHRLLGKDSRSPTLTGIQVGRAWQGRAWTGRVWWRLRCDSGT
jgi:hypothetical protein